MQLKKSIHVSGKCDNTDCLESQTRLLAEIAHLRSKLKILEARSGISNLTGKENMCVKEETSEKNIIKKNFELEEKLKNSERQCEIEKKKVEVFNLHLENLDYEKKSLLNKMALELNIYKKMFEFVGYSTKLKNLSLQNEEFSIFDGEKKIFENLLFKFELLSVFSKNEKDFIQIKYDKGKTSIGFGSEDIRRETSSYLMLVQNNKPSLFFAEVTAKLGNDSTFHHY